MLSFFCPCPKGLEVVLYNEICALSLQYPNANIQYIKLMSSGIGFKGDMLACYTVNLYSRIASRVLLHVNSAPCRTEDEVYEFAHKQMWADYFAVHQTLRLDINAHQSTFKSLNFINLRVKDAICDYFRTKTGKRPSIDTIQPEIRVMVFLNKNVCSLYIDTSGDALFRRGWRQAIGEAPIKENLAAGILYLSNWHKDMTQPLYDPMCGSGTFLIEAMHMALNIAPGISRHFGFEDLKIHQSNQWQQLKLFAQKAKYTQVNNQNKLSIDYIIGSDISERMLNLAQENAERAGVALNLELMDARSVCKKYAKGILIANPPYGERISMRGAAPKVFTKNRDGSIVKPIIEKPSAENLEVSDAQQQAFYSEWASNLKKQFSDWQVGILSADLDLPKYMRLKPKQKIPLFNGNLECRLFMFDMVDGGMRKE
jgi:putative N6-adenine-specific DNA methylase